MTAHVHIGLIKHPPDTEVVHRLLGRYVPVRLSIEKNHLLHGDQLALAKLIDAAHLIDPIYWRQRSDFGWELARAVRMSNQVNGELDRLLRINYGPWDNLNGDAPFWGDSKIPMGANFYPTDLNRDTFNAYLESHPGDAENLLKATTLVRRDGDRLVARPYEEEYRAELNTVAQHLINASASVTDESFRRYLIAHADGLRSGNLVESQRLWVQSAESPIDIVIGPYEVYDDALRNVKTSYAAAVLVKHPLTVSIREFEDNAVDLGQGLPGAVAEDPLERRVRIGVFDVAFASGMLNMGSKAIAIALPNDEQVRIEVGARLLLFRNLIEAKCDSILKPLAARVLHTNEFGLVDKQAFLLHTLLHEAGHVLGSGYVHLDGRRLSKTIKEALGERYSTIEEARADLLGLHFLRMLVANGVLPPHLLPAAATTFVVSCLRSVRFGEKSDHGRAAAIVLSHLAVSGAIWPEGDQLRIDPDKTHRVLGNLVLQVQAIATAGDYESAGRLIKRYGSTPAPLANLLTKTTTVPIDIELIFDGQPASAAFFGRPAAATG